MDVYRKPTHTNRYLDFLSHHPSCNKRSVVNTLLLRARNIPCTSKGKRAEMRRVKAVLRENSYSSCFINEYERGLALKQATEAYHKWFCSTSLRSGRLRKSWSLTINNKVYKSPTSHGQPSTVFLLDQNDRTKPTVHLSGVVYRINCSHCDFVYYGQTERSLNTRVSEHKKAVLTFYHNPKLAKL